MILTWMVPATQDREILDALNRASGEIYSRVLVHHWRFYRKQGIWLKKFTAMQVDDRLSEGQSILHSHSIDAAQEGFYKAVKTARELRKVNDKARFPYKRKWYRSTFFKSTQIKMLEDNQIRLAMAGKKYLFVTLPRPLDGKPDLKVKEVRLVYNRKSCSYEWHIVVEDGIQPPILHHGQIMGIDLGELHPAVCATKEDAFIVSCRELRSTVQFRNKVLAELQTKMSKCVKRSNHWYRLRAAKIQRRAYFERKIRDLEHKISTSIVRRAKDLSVKTIVIGDVRNIGSGKRLAKKSQQKISQWSHGRIRSYITYKAARLGISVVLEGEAYTSQTCPMCKTRKKPKGRNYRCKNKKCGFVGHRDVVGAANILSKHIHGEPGGMYPGSIGHVHPHDCRKNNHLTYAKVSGVSASSGPCERSHVAWEQLSLF